MSLEIARTVRMDEEDAELLAQLLAFLLPSCTDEVTAARALGRFAILVVLKFPMVVGDSDDELLRAVSSQ